MSDVYSICCLYVVVIDIVVLCNDTATTEIYTYGHTLSLHDALPISRRAGSVRRPRPPVRTTPPAGPPHRRGRSRRRPYAGSTRSEEHTSELQSLMRTSYAVFCLNKKKTLEKSTRNDQTRYSTLHT